MLGKRILTAVIGIPVAAYVINYGEWLFATAILILTLLAWHEFYTMLQNKNIKIYYILGFVLNIVIAGCAWIGNSQELIMVMFISTLLALVKIVTSGAEFTVTDAAFSLLGIFYIGVSFAHLILLRYTDNSQYISTSLGQLSAGAAYLWIAFIGTWASDTFAYFVGTYLGKHKLCPKISPGKTIEGALGGLLGSVIVIVLLGNLFKLSIIHSMIMGLLIGIVAPIGDLVESVIKRFTGVKDSGRILPGHGGILDRFDSILFVVPAIYYYIHAFVLK
ncbi:phosphatidate cytidylyltransferase [Pelosinus sp. sgz500959]|uniref:phosphatidate cytidylyltransferase n=1 Tax=Pelosinus sp. sgz500959 TaxID=3242472 RepID=UPI003672E6B0